MEKQKAVKTAEGNIMAENKILLTFGDTRTTILAERECKKKGFKCEAVPTPGACGIALEVPADEKDKVVEFLTEQKRPFEYFLSANEHR